MKNLKNKIIRFLKFFFIGFFSLLALYFITYWILSSIEVEGETVTNPTIEVQLMQSGVHSDFVLPIKNKHKDWREEFPIENTNSKDTNVHFVSIGWGDREFYMNTPSWSDLSLGTAFRASFGLNNSAIHAFYYYELPKDRKVVTVKISESQYKKLVRYIETSLSRTATGKSKYIPPVLQEVMFNNDAYYEAKASYSMFFTCNCWVNDGLKAAGMKAVVWTPFSDGIFDLYEE